MPAPMEILSEHAAGSSPTSALIAALVGQGVDVAALLRRVEKGAIDPFRMDRIRPLSKTAFEFAAPGDDETLGAITFLVRDEDGEVGDICAWAPGHFTGLWLGRGALLGAHRIFAPRLSEGLPVFDRILPWLEASCRGVVVLDLSTALPLLRRAAPLHAQSLALARTLRLAFERRPPRILVSKGAP